MGEMDLNSINTEIEGKIKQHASKVELVEGGSVLRVNIPDAVGLNRSSSIDWWLDFVNQSIFEWAGQTFYCCDVEISDDSHIWICRPVNLHDAFPLDPERENTNQEQLGLDEIPGI